MYIVYVYIVFLLFDLLTSCKYIIAITMCLNTEMKLQLNAIAYLTAT